MQVAVREHHKAAVLRTGVPARLFLAHQRVLVLGFGLQHQQGEAAFIQQQEIQEAAGGRLEILTEGIDLFLCDLDMRFKLDIGRAVGVIKEPPPGAFQELVDFDARSGFFAHSSPLLARSPPLKVGVCISIQRFSFEA